MRQKFLRQKHSQPKLNLTDLLRRRKMTLKQFLAEFGITTYGMLVIRCERMGVTPPEHKLFVEAAGLTVISSPTEGVIVLEPPPVIEENTGKKIDIDSEDAQENCVKQEEDTISSSRNKLRKKRDNKNGVADE